MNDELVEHEDFGLLRALPRLLLAQEALHVNQGRGIRCRTMADEVWTELESIGTGWNDDDIDRVQSSLLPRLYDLLNLLAIADGAEPEEKK
jgi:hypothetical protein